MNLQTIHRNKKRYDKKTAIKGNFKAVKKYIQKNDQVMASETRA